MRSYFETAPASIVVRLTNQLVAGYETYGFKRDGTFPEVIQGILNEEPILDRNGKPEMETAGGEKRPKMAPAPDYTGSEFYLGGKIVKEMPEEKAKRLGELGSRSIGISAASGYGRRQVYWRVNMLALYVEAPFAAFRTFTAGWYRPTAAFLTPSAAYGCFSMWPASSRDCARGKPVMTERRPRR